VSKIKVEIEYIANNPNSEISEVSFPSRNNTSTGAVLNGNVNMQPLVWGASKWGDSAKFISKYNGFASEQCSNAQGEFSPPISFTITGTEIESLRIRFAASLGQYATELKVDGNTYINDSLTFITAGLTGDSHTVEIVKWSAPKFNARIDSIGMGVVTEYTERQIMELVAGNYSTANEEEPAYGLISQYGNLTIKDIENEIKQLAQQQLLSPNSPIKITFKDEQQGNFLSDEWKYSINEVSVGFKDSVLALQEVNYEKNVVPTLTALQLLNEAISSLNINASISNAATTALSKVKITYPTLNSTAWDAITYLISLGHIRAWIGKDGVLIVEAFSY
jgi:hypothetical protein